MRRRRRRRKSPRRLWVIGSLVTVAGILGYAQFISPVLEGEADEGAASHDASSVALPPNSRPRLTSTRPETSSPKVNDRVSEKGARDSTQRRELSAATAERRSKLLAAGREALERSEPVTARAYLSEAVTLGLSTDELIEARAALVRIGTETIFSGAMHPDDPLVRQHVVSPGESLSKIAGKYQVTSDFIAAINNIANKNMIRAGQNLKVVQGPFHIRIDKRTFRMDVYLQDTFVRQYQVGLGANDSTPAGEWVVGAKLVNPTYYPPRGGRIVAADDPQNPLGERWIELVGIAGAARGQRRYGIHGTIAPESIGSSESLGCIRMHNEDIAEVFTLLVPKKSHVFVR